MARVVVPCGRSLTWCDTRYVIELVTRDEVLSLRHTVFRPHLPPSSAEYPEDNRPGIFHLGVRDDSGTLISCVTFLPEPFDGEPAWRFRGMATAAAHRNHGIGGRLLAAGLAEVAVRGGNLVWCNGRSAAADFYQRHGFTVSGEEFDLPPIGKHLVFVRTVG
jgi:predicted GNAT family N-acyltransferase